MAYGSKMVDIERATIGVMDYAPTDINHAYHYELTVPHLLSRDQMELILRMIGQMKRGYSPEIEPISFFWRKEEP